MPLPFELTAENVVNYARENRIKMGRFIKHSHGRLCAREVLLHAALKNEGVDFDDFSHFYFSKEGNEKIGLSEPILVSLEKGFEGFHTSIYDMHKYVEMGAKIYDMYVNG